MNRAARKLAILCLGAGALAAAALHAQKFGASKEKVTLQRKLPALIHLPGETIKVTVTSADEDGALPYDFQALLETELLKDDPNLRDDDNPATQIICQITDYSHPDPTYRTRAAPGIAFGSGGIDLTKSATKTAQFERITGQLNVSFQAKDANGHMLISDNISSSFDGEYDSEGNSTSHGMMGELTGRFSHMKGGAKSEDLNPPTPAELRSRLIIDAVQQIAEHLVDTDETVDAFWRVRMARSKKAIRRPKPGSGSALWRPMRRRSHSPNRMRMPTGSTTLAWPTKRSPIRPIIRRLP